MGVWGRGTEGENGGVGEDPAGGRAMLAGAAG